MKFLFKYPGYIATVNSDLTLLHPFMPITASRLTQCSQIIGSDVIIKSARRIFLTIQRSGENMKFMLRQDTPSTWLFILFFRYSFGQG